MRAELQAFSFRLFLAVFLFAACALAATPNELLAAGRADAAVHDLQERIGQNAHDAEAQNLLCRAYFMLEEWDRGISACERARTLDPQNSLYSLWLGRVYGEKADRAGFMSAAGIAKKVRSAFERAVELDPKNWQARTDLAEFYIDAPSIVGGGKDKARQQADALMPINPAMSHWVAARIAEKNKDIAEAEREYRAAIAVNHASGRAWFDLANCMRHADRFDEMEKALQHLESAPVDRAEAIMDGASILIRTGRNLPLAARLLRRYLSAPVEEGPAFKAHNLLGEVLEKQGDPRAAAEEYRAALAMAHGYSRAQENLKRVER